MFLFEDSKIILDKPIYHCSLDNHNNEIFYPKRFDGASSKVGLENPEARICFSDSIQGCLRSIIQNIYDIKFYVHVPYNQESLSIYQPTKKDVYDVEATHELWIKQPVKMKCIGRILVYDIDNNNYIDIDIKNQLYKKLRFYNYKYKFIEKY